MYVVAKTIGPTYSSNFGCLTIGKKYKANHISYQINNNWIHEKFIYNPKEANFYICVIDDHNKEHYIWNDNFYSTYELRKNKLKKLNEYIR